MSKNLRKAIRGAPSLEIFKDNAMTCNTNFMPCPKLSCDIYILHLFRLFVVVVVGGGGVIYIFIYSLNGHCPFGCKVQCAFFSHGNQLQKGNLLL